MDHRAEIEHHQRDCFICGKQNQFGLQVDFEIQGSKSVAFFLPDEHYQSYRNIIHGGVLSSLMDAAMNRILLHRGFIGRTGKLTVRFVKEAAVNRRLTVIGEVISLRKMFAVTKSEIRDDNDALIAEAEAVFVRKENRESR